MQFETLQYFCTDALVPEQHALAITVSSQCFAKNAALPKTVIIYILSEHVWLVYIKKCSGPEVKVYLIN